MSASKLYFARAGNFLVSTDEKGLKFIRNMGDGEEIAFKPMRVRSLRAHKSYWLMISRVAEHISEFNISLGKIPAMMPITCPYDLHTAIKLVTGHCITQKLETSVGFGQKITHILRIPKPTDFEHMTADEWNEFRPRALDAIHERALPQIEIPEVEQDLAQLAS